MWYSKVLVLAVCVLLASLIPASVVVQALPASIGMLRHPPPPPHPLFFKPAVRAENGMSTTHERVEEIARHGEWCRPQCVMDAPLYVRPLGTCLGALPCPEATLTAAE